MRFEASGNRKHDVIAQILKKKIKFQSVISLKPQIIEDPEIFLKKNVCRLTQSILKHRFSKFDIFPPLLLDVLNLRV